MNLPSAQHQLETHIQPCGHISQIHPHAWRQIHIRTLPPPSSVKNSHIHPREGSAQKGRPPAV